MGQAGDPSSSSGLNKIVYQLKELQGLRKGGVTKIYKQREYDSNHPTDLTRGEDQWAKGGRVADGDRQGKRGGDQWGRGQASPAQGRNGKGGKKFAEKPPKRHYSPTEALVREGQDFRFVLLGC